MKRFVKTVTAIALMAALTVTASAANPDGYSSVSLGGGEAVIDVTGKVEPVTLAATVEISTYMSIDPNQANDADKFVSPTLHVENNCNAPITLYAMGMKATGSAPKVVAESTFTDAEWTQLNKKQTHENIALGLTDGGLESSPVVNMWFAREADQTSVKLCDIPYQGTHNMKLQAKFGRTWESSASYKYSMTLKIGLKQ